MPKRTDIKTIMIIGAGPIVIGQACEFDYSGVQACKALREEGYRVVLVNSNPATIMTDPEMADATYVEPVNWKSLELIIAKERPDAILPTMGGQTALNCALDLAHHGILEKYGVELVGASPEAIDMAENRDLFRKAMDDIGLHTPDSWVVHTQEEANKAQEIIGFPTIIRPSFTLGGSGGGVAYNKEEFAEICQRGFDLSPTNELLIEQSVLGWKEFEMEVVRDKADNCIIICSIENLDPMGIHTGDSITIAPAQTLTDKEYQRLRNASIAVLRKIGVDTGGSNVQFAINPANGDIIIIEMNPRVSRSSALASKATGFPIAKVAAKLAVGFTLDELSNDITGGRTPASFEPSIDYVVCKMPRFAFEKFPQAEALLTTQMKSVGEVMAIGRSFQESFQKALRGIEGDYHCLQSQVALDDPEAREKIIRALGRNTPDRLLFVADAFRHAFELEEIYKITTIDPWFLSQIQEIIQDEGAITAKNSLHSLDAEFLFTMKRKGFSDQRIAELLCVTENEVREYRFSLNIHPVFKRIDTCAAEFETDTAYLYSSYEMECEALPTERKKVIVLGSGPNRIGQGIEFDYCCVHAAMAIREAGYESIMVNCNPETVSTDFDTSDRLYFEPLTLEDVYEIIRIEKPMGVIVQFGGQTPLKLAEGLMALGVPILGTSPDAIDLAEDRERFKYLVDQLGLLQPENGLATDLEGALAVSKKIGFPLMVRPSYVLGGRAMETVYNEEGLRAYMEGAVIVSNDRPVLLDRFLSDAIEVDADVVCDGVDVVIGGIMEHIEQAGVHSGDSACSLPPYSLSQEVQDEMRSQLVKLAKSMGVLGLMNVQFAVQQGKVYIIEVNPRASRTVPFVSKACGRSMVKVATRCMLGESLQSQGVTEEIIPSYYAVKEAVFPFSKFQGVDPLLGPEMKSTGEVMGIGHEFSDAFSRSQEAASCFLPESGQVFVSVRDEDKESIVDLVKQLLDKGFSVIATTGTTAHLKDNGVEVKHVNKMGEGRPDIIDAIKNSEVALVINTTQGVKAIGDSFSIRREAINRGVAYTTTLAGARATCMALKNKSTGVYSLQELHKEQVA